MIQTVQEGLEKYKETLRKYKEWTDGRKKYYDRVWGNGKWNAFVHFTKTDLTALYESTAELKAMVKVLGLTKEEEKKIDEECGIKSQEELAQA